MPHTILLDVDTQADFILAKGALSVPGAETLLGKLGALVRGARDAGVPHWATTDTHTPDDPEFEAYGFPAHCVQGTPGWARVPATAQLRPLVVPLRPWELARPEVEAPELAFWKASFDVGSNPAFAPALRLGEVKEAYVVGVATEYCVRAACLSLVAAGVRVHVVVDAIAAVDSGAGVAALAELEAAGVLPCRAAEALAVWKRRQEGRLGA